MGQGRDDDADAAAVAPTEAAPVVPSAPDASARVGTKPSLLAMTKCLACGVFTPVARYCTDCGVALAPRRFCSNCGAPSKPGAPFCGTCGTPSS